MIVRNSQAAQNLTGIVQCQEKGCLTILIKGVIRAEQLTHAHPKGRDPLGGVTVEIKGELDEGLTVLVIILGNLNNFHGMSGLLLFSATYPVRFEIKDLRRGLLLFEIITDILNFLGEVPIFQLIHLYRETRIIDERDHETGIAFIGKSGIAGCADFLAIDIEGEI